MLKKFYCLNLWINKIFPGIITIILLLVANYSHGQDNKPGFKTWFDYTIAYNFNKKYTIQYNQIWSMNTSPYRLGFVQNDFRFSYRLKHRTFLSVGYVWSLFKDSQSLQSRYSKGTNIFGMLDFNRVYVQFSKKHKLFSKRILLKHTGAVQYFFPELKKYEFRLTYAAKVYFVIKNFPWRGVPYIENKFYVYLGGIPADYFDETGNIVDTRPPDGLHRYRLKTGVRLRPSKARFYITPYFFYQREFNSFLFPSSDLNIAIPNTNKVSYRFNNYYVAGLNLEYRFKKK